jgi:hypothetical protein
MAKVYKEYAEIFVKSTMCEALEQAGMLYGKERVYGYIQTHELTSDKPITKAKQKQFIQNVMTTTESVLFIQVGKFYCLKDKDIRHYIANDKYVSREKLLEAVKDLTEVKIRENSYGNTNAKVNT